MFDRYWDFRNILLSKFMCVSFERRWYCRQHHLLLNCGIPSLEAASVLKDQVNILSNDDIMNCNPLEVTDPDVDKAVSNKYYQ